MKFMHALRFKSYRNSNLLCQTTSKVFPFGFIIFLALKEVSMMYAIGMYSNFWWMLLANLAPTLLLVSPIFWLKGRWQIFALIGADVLITVLFYANIVFFRAFRDFISVATLLYIGQLGEVENAVFALLSVRDLIYFFDLLFLPAVLLATGCIRFPRRVRVAPAGLLIGMLCTGGLIANDPTNLWEGPTITANHLGLLNYQIKDIVRYGSQLTGRIHPSQQTIATVKSYFADAPASTSGMYGAYKGKNVIFLQIESLHDFVIGMKVNGQEITPALNRLRGESISFTNFYAETGEGSSADAEFLAHCSIHPAPKGVAFVSYAGNQLSCLPDLLKARGYKTAVMHSDRPDFWNRAAIYPKIGIDRYFNKDDFDQSEQVRFRLGDASFLQQSVSKLEQLPQPFDVMLMTFSSHTPFSEKWNDFRMLELGPLENTITGDYLQIIHYVDATVGQFIDRLRENGLLDTTVLLAYGDHAILKKTDSGLATLLDLSPTDEVGRAKAENRVPLFIRLPDGRVAERADLASEIDLAPTVAGLLGIPDDDTLFMGHDLFAGPASSVVLHNGSIITTDKMYLTSANHYTGGCYESSGNSLPLTDCAPLAQQAKNELFVSGQILNLNLQPSVRHQLGTAELGTKDSPKT